MALDQNFKVPLIPVLASMIASTSKDAPTHDLRDVGAMVSDFKLRDASAPTFEIFVASNLRMST